MKEMIIIKYGGSILSPNENGYSETAISELVRLLPLFKDEEFCLIIGGGHICRTLQNASEQVLKNVIPQEQMNFALDEIGIATTKINANYLMHILRHEFHGEVCDELVIDPHSKPKSGYRIYLATGARPGHSTDYDTMALAESFEADRAIKISDFPVVLNVKPAQFDKEKIADYEELPQISWQALQELVGYQWQAGANYPLDPHAAILGVNLSHRDCGFTLLIGQYSELEKMIAGKEFVGTRVE